MVKVSTIGKRPKKAIINAVKRLEEKYSDEVVRAVINKHYAMKKMRKDAEKEKERLEDKLNKIKKQLR